MDSARDGQSGDRHFSHAQLALANWAPVLRADVPSQEPLANAFKKWAEHFERCEDCAGSYSSPDVLCAAGRRWFSAWDRLACHSVPRTK